MFFQLTHKVLKSAVISDNSWPRIKFNKTQWERVDCGVWLNLSTNILAIEQNGTWRYNGRRFNSIKDLLVEESN